MPSLPPPPASFSTQIDGGEIHFTVTNQRDRSVEGRAHLEAEHDRTESWIAVRGPAQRTFAPAGTERYTVDIDVPSDAPGGSHHFRLDMVGVKQPDEDYTRGQTVTFEVPPAKSTPALGAGSPWREIITAVVVLALAVGGVAWWTSGSGNGKEEEARPVPVRPEDPSEERATEMTSTTLTDRPPIPLPGREGRFIFGNYSNRDMDPNCTVTSVSARLLGAQGIVEVYEDAVGTNNLHVGVEYEVDREKARVEVAGRWSTPRTWNARCIESQAERVCRSRCSRSESLLSGRGPAPLPPPHDAPSQSDRPAHRLDRSE